MIPFWDKPLLYFYFGTRPITRMRGLKGFRMTAGALCFPSAPQKVGSAAETS